MIIRKFQAETENGAILKAKAELGGDAVVMNIKTIKPRGLMRLFKKPYVEITAALDEDKKKDPTELQTKLDQREAKKEDLFTETTFDKKQNFTETGISDNPIIKELERKEAQQNKNDALEKKLNDIQSLLEEKLAGEEQKAVEEEKKQEEAESEAELYTKLIYNKLLEQEVDEKYANLIIDELDRSINKEGGLDHVLSTVYQKMILKLGESKPIVLDKKLPKVVFFIGPTGVGKTTTIAKIASKFTLDDKKKVAMLTADTYRIAATEQLHTYADILNLPFKVIYKPEEIVEAVEEYKDYDLILVDTAGHSHQNQQQMSDIRSFLDSVKEEEQKEIFLVLSATTKYRDLISIADSYKEIKGFKLIFTKLDETTCCGNILNLKLYTDADLSYLTCGQNVPDDIEKLDAQKIVKQLMGGR